MVCHSDCQYFHHSLLPAIDFLSQSDENFYHNVSAVTCVVLMKNCLSLRVCKTLKYYWFGVKFYKNSVFTICFCYFCRYLHTYKILLPVKTINFLFYQVFFFFFFILFLFNWGTGKTKTPILLYIMQHPG